MVRAEPRRFPVEIFLKRDLRAKCVGAGAMRGRVRVGRRAQANFIGRLQRYAMDHINNRKLDMFRPAAPQNKSVAVIGGGPAGLSCAGELAKRGYSVTLFEKRDFAGGLSTYGIIGLRDLWMWPLAEVEMIRRLVFKWRAKRIGS